MKRLLLIVPDGVGVRNYLYSNFVKELQKESVQIILYHQISNEAIKEIELIHPSITQIQKLPRFVEKPFTRLFRESAAYARLLFNKKQLNNDTVMDFWNKNQKGIKQKFLYRLAELLGSILSVNYKYILKMEHIYDKEIVKDKNFELFVKDLEDLKPDIILNLHQRAPISAPIILAAKKLNIATSTVIFSWDNVPKGRLISRYSTYFTWSEYMKKQLEFLYPDINNNQVKVVGTPQFEFYFDENIKMDKTSFFLNYGLDSSKKTVCFSANDATSPYEANYLNDVCIALSKMDSSIRPQLIFRRSPVDKSNRFDTILEKYNHLIFCIDPDWRIEKNSEESFSSIYPAYNDLSLLINTVLHSDVVINFGSTMAHDFAIYDKPCLYLNYDPVEQSIFKVDMAYKFPHFESMQNFDAVGWLNSAEEIAEKINLALTHPEQVGKDRKKWLEKIAQHPLEDSSRKIANIILC